MTRDQSYMIWKCTGRADAADVPAFRAKRALELATAAGADALRDLAALVDSAPKPPRGVNLQ